MAVRFTSNTVTFGSQYCITHCHDAPATIQGVTEEPPEPVYQVKEILEPKIRPLRPCRGYIVMLDRAWFFGTVKNGRLSVCKALLYDIKKAIEGKDLKECPLKEIVPEQYHQFPSMFYNVLADRLPSHRPGIDHEIRLKVGETPTWGQLYLMSRAELIVLKQWHGENMSKGFIQQSSLPLAAQVLFATKPGGGRHFRINYLDINCKTLKNRYHLPLIKETIEHLTESSNIYYAGCLRST